MGTSGSALATACSLISCKERHLLGREEDKIAGLQKIFPYRAVCEELDFVEASL